MTVTNLFTTFSEAPEGIPITVNSTSAPGTLIHTTTNELDSIWLWAGHSLDTPYTETLYVQILKGNGTLGYTPDALIKLPAGKKVLIENGIILTGNAEFRMYIDTLQSTATTIPDILVTGYVHRRV